MKFRMIDLGYKSTPDYPFTHRIELLEYSFDEQAEMYSWLEQCQISHRSAGPRSNVVYIGGIGAELFALKWT